MIEKLTDEERGWLESDPEFQMWDVRRKVLRIIDAQAAEIERATQHVLKAEAAELAALEKVDMLSVHKDAETLRANAAEAQPAAPARTEAEQAVLDAAALIPAEWLEDPGALALEVLALAELARRGLK